MFKGKADGLVLNAAQKTRLISMENEHITDRVFLWDREQNNSFSLELSISKYSEFLNMERTYTNVAPCNLSRGKVTF